MSDAQAAAAGGEVGSPAALSATDPMLALLGMAFDDEGKMEEDLRGEWCSWLGRYARRLNTDAMGESVRRAVMKAGSPKFIPREWMLVDAYEAAEKGDFSVLNELQVVRGWGWVLGDRAGLGLGAQGGSKPPKMPAPRHHLTPPSP